MNETFDSMGNKVKQALTDEMKSPHEFNPTWDNVRREGQAVGHQAKAVAEKARDVADTVKDSFSELKHKAADRMDMLRARSFRENAEAARDQIQRHPGTAMLLSLALGLAIGKSISSASASARRHRLATNR
jgi:ElaB/YqjD/DUF883 family membrane-anchored ribosome-binding protein